jgi:hypothetical protein
MNERRSVERFDIRLPAWIESVAQESKAEALALKTVNVSSGGAFFRATRPLPQNMRVKVEMDLHAPGSANGGATVEVTGRVCRSETTGMAVRFDKAYKIRANDKILYTEHKQESLTGTSYILA